MIERIIYTQRWWPHNVIILSAGDGKTAVRARLDNDGRVHGYMFVTSPVDRGRAILSIVV